MCWILGEHLHKGDGANGANLVQSTEQTKLGSSRVAKVLNPRFEVLHRVEEHAVGKISVSKLCFLDVSNRLTHRNRWWPKQCKE